MAYVKTPKNKITNRTTLRKVVNYITQPEKTGDGRYVYKNMCSENVVQDFYDIKKQQGVTDEKLVSFHFIQSFKRSEADMETAFEITKEWAEKMFPGYQYVIATHNDAENIINSHIVLNSVSYATGKKYHDNKESLSVLRNASDDLCKQYGLSIIEKPSGRKSIDRSTYELAMQGKSWKVKLVNDLDEILKGCTSKESFINELEKKGYRVDYKNVHIVITKQGQKKGIRIDTLAKQFGNQYSKESIEKNFLDIEHVPKIQSESKKSAVQEIPDINKSEWARYERYTFSKRTFQDKEKRGKVVNQTLQKMMFLKNSINYSQNLMSYLIRSFILAIYMMNKKNRVQFKKVTTKKYVKGTFQKNPPFERYIGNISYKQLSDAYGENITIPVSMEQLIQFERMDIFYAGAIKNNDKVYVTFKKNNSQTVSSFLGVDVSAIKTKDEISYERYRHKKIKEFANRNNRSLLSYKVTNTELKNLDDAKVAFSYFRKDNQYSIYFLNSDLKNVCSVLGKDFEKENQYFASINNRKTYAELKKNSQSLNEKLEYRIIDENGLNQLRNSNLKFACFPKENNRYNVAFMKGEEKHYEEIMKRNEYKSRDHHL